MRIVTLCGSTSTTSDAVRDYEEIIEERLTAQGIDVRAVDLGKWGIRSIPSIIREVRNKKPELILMQYPTEAFGRSMGPPFFAALQTVAPLIINLHEFSAGHPLRKLATGLLTIKSDFVVTTAAREADSLSSWYPWLQARTRVIPISSNMPTLPWAPVLPQRIVYFGQLRPEKGIECFFQCHTQLAGRFPEVEFRLIGASVSKFASYGSEIIKQAHARGIRLLHGPEPKHVSLALSRATIALLPFPTGASFRRGSLLAAAGCGVPIVTTSGVDTPPTLGSYLDLAESPAQLVDLTSKLLMDEQRRVKAHRKSVRLAEDFGWSNVVNKFIDLFSEVARSSK